MTTEHVPVPVSPLQLKLKAFCVWIETKFECRLARAPFALRMAVAAVVFGILHYARTSGRLDAHWTLGLVAWLLFGWAAFWTTLEIVRRFHDLGRTGGLFWAIAIPFWASVRISDLFHLTEKGAEAWWLWVVLTVLCLWSIGLTLQLFLKRGTAGPNGYDGRGFYANAKIQ